MYMKQKNFKKAVMVGGNQYFITDELVYKHYQNAQKVLTDENKIIGFQHEYPSRGYSSKGHSSEGYSSGSSSNKKHS